MLIRQRRINATPDLELIKFSLHLRPLGGGVKAERWIYLVEDILSMLLEIVVPVGKSV